MRKSLEVFSSSELLGHLILHTDNNDDGYLTDMVAALLILPTEERQCEFENLIAAESGWIERLSPDTVCVLGLDEEESWYVLR